MLSGLSNCVQLILLLMNSFAVSSEPPVLIIFRHMTHLSKTQWLKTTRLLSHSFCGSGIQTWLTWIFYLYVSHKIRVLLRLDSGIDLLPSLLQQLLAGFSSLCANSPTASFLHKLLARAFPWYLAIQASPQCNSQYGSWLPSSKRGRVKKMEVTVFCNPILEVISYHFRHILFIGRK